MFIGHQTQIQLLQSALQNGKLSHAYLFAGPDGIGKKLVAEKLVRLLLCLEWSENGEPCGACQNCKFSLEQHPNAKLLGYDSAVNPSAPLRINGEPGRTIKIETIRELKQFFQLKPFSGNIRTVILNNADNCTAEAANAFLKLLEEPPKDSYFFLITAKPQNLPQTIVSRTSIIRFPQVPKQELADWLQKEYRLVKVEGERIAQLAMGRPAWALQWLEQNGEKLLKKMSDIVSGREIFQWQDWEEEGGWLPVLSQLALHRLLASLNPAGDKIFPVGNRILEAEQIVNSTNVNPRLVWENVFWQ